MSKKKSSHRNKGLVFEELEPRLLLSADPLAVATDAGGSSVHELVVDNNEDQVAIVQTQVEQSVSPARNELVIIDSRAPNFQQLHNDLIEAQQQGRNVHVVILDAHRDGIEQINEALSSHNKLDALHIVSHGDDAQVQLGASQLNKTTLRDRSADIAQWRQAFSEGGDLLIYGCDLASSSEGRSMVHALGYLTATDVAASDDLTGNSLDGGDWELEYEAGDIETDVAFSEQVQDNWQGTLEGSAPAAQEEQPAEEQQQEKQAQAELLEQQTTRTQEDQETTSEDEQQQQVAITQQQRQEVVFIDESVTDFQAFIDDLQKSSDATTTLEVYLLDGRSDGVDYINDVLSEYEKIDAVHIYSHGDDAAVKLGTTWLNPDNLDKYSSSLSAWSGALDANADILIYGCDLAQSEKGEQFASDLAQLTGADVAASDDLTGHDSLGADWELEYSTGSIESRTSISSELQQSWGHVMTVAVDNSSSGSAANVSSITVPHTTSGTSRLMLVGISTELDPGNTVDSVTYNGVNLTLEAEEEYSINGNAHVQIWSLLAPDVGIHDVVVNMAAAGDNGIIVGVMTFTGVNQTDPLLGFVSESGKSAAPSATVSSATDDLVFGILSLHDNNIANSTPDAGTEYWDVAADHISGAGIVQAGGGIVTSSWTTTSKDWSVAAISIQADTNSAQTTSLSVVQDAYIQEAAPTTNDGASGSMTVASKSGSEQRSLLQYDLSSIPPGATIQSAVLRLDASAVTGDMTVNAYQLTETWAEGSTTWNESSSGTNWTTAGGAFNATPLDSRTALNGLTGSYNWDITSLAQDWLDGVEQNYGLMFSSPDGGQTWSIDYDTREGATPPVLEIVYETRTAPVATDDPGGFNSTITSYSPSGYWRLGETSGTSAADDGTSGINGTYNGVTLGQAGAINGDSNTAVSFDGVDDYIEIANDPAYLLDDGTVQLWFNTADVNQRADLFSKDALGNGTGGHLSVYLDGLGNIETRLQSNTTSYRVTSTLPLTNNQWHHVAFTFGAGGMQLYVDGQLQDSDAYTGGMGITSGDAGNFEPIAIGASTQVSGGGTVAPLQDYYAGSIDEVALIATPLSAEQIQDLYASALQNYTIVEDASLVVAATEGVLINDSDPDADPLTASLVAGPSNAAAFSLNPDGSFSYTPLANFSGTDTFTYMANDGGSDSNVATVTITVTGVNDAPAARDDRIGLVFDGFNDYVTIGDYAGLNVTTNVTMEAWIKPTGLGTGSKIIVNKEGEYEMAINATTGEVKWAFDNVDPNWVWHNTGYFVQAGEWTHLAVTYDNGVVNTYANGVLVDSYNGSGAIADQYSGFNQLQIGGRENAVDQRFDGQIDEVRIWNSTRSQLDIQNNMNTLLTGAEAGLIGNWRFDEGSGITVEDQSVFGHHGTLADGVTAGEMPAWQGYVVSEDGILTVTALNGVLPNDYDIDGDPLTAVLDTGPVNAAAFNLNPDGSFTYTPTADFNGIDSFTYHANDGTVDSNIATVTIRVYPVNDAPQATNLNAAETYTEDTALNLTDIVVSDIDSANVTVTLILSDPAAGSLNTATSGLVTSTFVGDTWTASGAIADVNTLLAGLTFTPSLNYNSNFSIATSVDDGVAPAITGSKAMTGTPVNDAPQATNLNAAETYTEDTALNLTDIAVSDVDSANVTVTLILSDPAAGALNTATSGLVTSTFVGDTWTASGAIDDVNTLLAGLVFTPSLNYNSNFSIATSVDDGIAPAITGSKSMTGTPVNDVPVANANTVTTTEDNAYNFTAADFTFSDVESDSLVSARITNLLLGGGTLTYGGGTAVISGNTLTVAQLNTLVYTPPASTNGSPLATFDFTVNDADLGVVTAQMSINVTAVNNAPTATNLNAAETYTEDTALNLTDIVVSDIDSANVTVTLTLSDITAGALNTATSGGVTSTFAGGVWTASGDIGDVNTLLAGLTFTPSLNYNSNFNIATSVSDGVAPAITGTKVMTGIAVNDPASIGGVDAGIVTEDIDPDMDNLLEVSGSLTIIDPDAGEANFVDLSPGVYGGTYGVITLNAAGDWDYAANTNQAAIQGLAAGATLLDTITVSSVDGTTHDINITIMGTNDAPVAGNDVANVNEAGSVIIDVAATDSDIDDALDLNSIMITGLPANGTVVVNGDGTVTYTHDGSETLLDSFTYTISDISGAVSNSATVTVNINPVNDPPAAGDDTATVVEGASVLIDLAANDSDADNALDLNSISIIGAPANGALVVNGDGTVTYNHDGSNTVSDSFTYTISDISGAISNTATVNITITAVNNAPTTTGIAGVTVSEDAANTNIDLNAAFDDSDNLDSELTYSIVGNNNIGLFTATGIDGATGRLTLDYAADMNGSAQISVRATDPAGLSVDTLFTVTVTPVNDAPVVQANTGMLASGTAQNVLTSSELNVTDIDNTSAEITYTITALPVNGALLLNGTVMAVNDTFTQADLDNNLLAYQPAGTASADQFGFTVADSSGAALTNNTFDILVQVVANNDDGDTDNGVPPDNGDTDEEPEPEDSSEVGDDGLPGDAGEYGGGYVPIGSTSAPQVPPPALSIDPVPEKPSQERVIEKEEKVAEAEVHNVETFAAVQVKSMDALWGAIDKMKQEMGGSSGDEMSPVEFKVAAAKSSGVVLTAGVVAWILRSGALLSSLMSTIPLWKGYDPLPILAYKDDEEKKEEDEIHEDKIPTSLEELQKLKKLKEKKSREVDVDSIFGGSATRE